MFETILEWILIGLEIVIAVLFLIVWLTPKETLDEVLKLEGDSNVN
jgi:hypothetical protein